MRLPHTSAQAFRAMMEIPGHKYEATARVGEMLGHEGVQEAVTEIGLVLLRADALNERWVSVTFWGHGGERLQAITRYWPEDGEEFRTEVSVLDENYGGYPRVLATALLERLSTEDRLAARGEVRPLGTNDEDKAAIIFHGPFETVCLGAPLVLREEARRG